MKIRAKLAEGQATQFDSSVSQSVHGDAQNQLMYFLAFALFISTFCTVDLFYAGETGGPQNANEEPDLGAQIWLWIWDITKVKVLELFEKFQSLMSEVLQHPKIEKRNHSAAENEDQLEDKVRSSLLLSVVILLIVVVARMYRA